MAEAMDESGDVAASSGEGPVTNRAAVASSREWRLIGETTPGASHLRAGIPNQDAMLQMRESSTGLPLILSISDGHGSSKCFRSDRGSRFAVTVGVGLMREYLNSYEASGIESEAAKAFPIEFVRRWDALVTDDLKREPLSKKELDGLEAKDGLRALKIVEEHPFLPYGATTLTVAIGSSFAIYLQLGDGEIISFSETGEAVRPLPKDERLIANETTSLCSATAAQDFRFFFQPLIDPLPALILMSTDGYANSFVDEAGFIKVGNDLLELLRSDGFDAVNQGVKGWLEEATRMGSGDDCTLGVICRMDALQRARPAESIVIGVNAPQSPTTQEEEGIAIGKEPEPAAEQI